MEVVERRTTTTTTSRRSSVRMSLRLMALPARWTARQINNIYHHGEHLVHFHHHHHESHHHHHHEHHENHLEIPTVNIEEPNNIIHKSNPDLCTTTTLLPFTTLDEEDEDYYNYTSPLSTPVTPTAPKLPTETSISYHPGFATLIRRRRGSMPIRGNIFFFCLYNTRKKNHI